MKGVVWAETNVSIDTHIITMQEMSDTDTVTIPVCLDWTADEVAEWIVALGFPQYKDCFISNFITGRKLIWIEASTLPRLGICDWNHIQYITKKVRELLHQSNPHWNRSITLPHRSNLGLFLEAKSLTGRRSDSLTYDKYM